MRTSLFAKARPQHALAFLQHQGLCNAIVPPLSALACFTSNYDASSNARRSRSCTRRILTTSCLSAQHNTADELHDSGAPSNASNSMNFPGGRVPFTDQLRFEGGPLTRSPPLSCYRTLDSKGAALHPSQFFSKAHYEPSMSDNTAPSPAQHFDQAM